MAPLISVIVPVYRVELYLRSCVDSLLAQTYQNLEIILVDDGSPDNCPAICDEYAEKDARIRVVHKENGGLSDARNAGLDIAKGDYIGFVDSDDWVAPDMYEYLYRGMQKYDADISVCEYYNCWKGKSVATYRPAVRVFKETECIEALLLLQVGNYAWNKLYKRELWSRDIRYPKGKLYEDVRTTYKLFEKAHLVVALPEPKVYYRRTAESITGNPSIQNKLQCVQAHVERFGILADRYSTPRSLMLKVIYENACELRTAIVANSKQDFLKSKPEIRSISDFLLRYESEICRAAGLGRLGRLACRFMARGGRTGWLRSAMMERVFTIKTAIAEYGFVKKSRAIWHRWKESEKKRYYYKTCSMYPLRNAVFIESRGGEDLAGNIFELAQEFCRRKMKVYLSVKDTHMDKVQAILKTGAFPGLTVVKKLSRAYYKAFRTSKYWFNDMVFEDVVVKRPGQVYVNTWHGTPLKTLEFDVLEQRHNTGGASRDFLKCDYLAVPSDFLFHVLLTSGCVDTLFRGKALYSGYPRNSVFFDRDKRAAVRKAIAPEGKEVFAYMPTWRGNFLSHTEASGEYSTENVLAFFERTLRDDQIMLVKLHNFATSQICFEKYKKVRPFPAQFDAYSVLNAVDCLITDYSSVFFDFANTRKKIVLFTYDKADYLRERGLYFALEEFPFPKSSNYDELAAELNLVKDYDDTSFVEAYCTYDGADSAKKIADYILGQTDACPTGEIDRGSKKNILLYDTLAAKRAELRPNDSEFLSGLDTQAANYFYCYPQWLLSRTPQYLKHMRPGIRLFTLTRNPISLWTEKIIMKLTRKKALRSQIKREKNRQIYGNVFDEIHLLGNGQHDTFHSIFEETH